MKIRNDFVTNSSSSSFVFSRLDDPNAQQTIISQVREIFNKYNHKSDIDLISLADCKYDPKDLWEDYPPLDTLLCLEYQITLPEEAPTLGFLLEAIEHPNGFTDCQECPFTEDCPEGLINNPTKCRELRYKLKENGFTANTIFSRLLGQYLLFDKSRDIPWDLIEDMRTIAVYCCNYML